MKKTKFSLIFIILFSFLFGAGNFEASKLDEKLEYESSSQDSIIQPNGTGDLRYLLSEMIKEEAINACGQVALLSNSTVAMTPDTPIDYPTLEETEYDSNSDSIVPSASSPFVNQYATSDAGSKIIMAKGTSITPHGYCHIFNGHMKNAEGYIYNYNSKTQFKFASYPSTAMDIAMEVINGADLKPEKDGKYSKTAYSSTAETRVKVILAKGFSPYSSYDWVIITMYPY